MTIEEHYLYVIKESFFKKFDPKEMLMINKEENRPHYYCFKGKDELYWIIPFSSKVEKYRKIENNDIKKYNKCDKFYFFKMGHKEHVLLIQNIFPISEKYFEKYYTISNNTVKIEDVKKNNEIKNKAENVLKKIKAGVFFFPGQKEIERIKKEVIIDNLNDKIIERETQLSEIKENIKKINVYELKIEGLESLIVKKDLLIKEDKKNTVLSEEKKELIFKRDTINEELKKYDKGNFQQKKDNIEKEIQELKKELKTIEVKPDKKIEDKRIEKSER